MRISDWSSDVCSSDLANEKGESNLVPNPGFESEDGWDVTLEAGATGDYGRDTSIAKSGGHAMKLAKTNGLGYVKLTTSEPIQEIGRASCRERVCQYW